MADDAKHDPGVRPADPAETGDADTAEDQQQDRGSERGSDRGQDRGITDFVRRAVSAGVGAASRSKEDIMRVAAAEVRTWLEHLNLNEEVAKALSKMVIEVKTEIRFRPQEDGRVLPETTNDVKIKGSNRP
jgi:hypothetical protein